MEIGALAKKISTSETARRAAMNELIKLRSEMITLEDYTNELHQKQDRAHKEKLSRQMEKEEHKLRRRAMWLGAEKGGKQGNSVGKITADNSSDTSETEDISSDE